MPNGPLSLTMTTLLAMKQMEVRKALAKRLVQCQQELMNFVGCIV